MQPKSTQGGKGNNRFNRDSVSMTVDGLKKLKQSFSKDELQVVGTVPPKKLVRPQSAKPVEPRVRVLQKDSSRAAEKLYSKAISSVQKNVK